MLIKSARLFSVLYYESNRIWVNNCQNGILNHLLVERVLYKSIDQIIVDQKKKQKIKLQTKHSVNESYAKYSTKDQIYTFMMFFFYCNCNMDQVKPILAKWLTSWPKIKWSASVTIKFTYLEKRR